MRIAGDVVTSVASSSLFLLVALDSPTQPCLDCLICVPALLLSSRLGIGCNAPETLVKQEPNPVVQTAHNGPVEVFWMAQLSV